MIAGGQPQVIAQTGQAGQPVIMGQVVQAAGQAAPLLIQQPQVGLLEKCSCILHLNLELIHTVRRLGIRLGHITKNVG